MSEAFRSALHLLLTGPTQCWAPGHSEAFLGSPGLCHGPPLRGRLRSLLGSCCPRLRMLGCHSLALLCSRQACKKRKHVSTSGPAAVSLYRMRLICPTVEYLLCGTAYFASFALIWLRASSAKKALFPSPISYPLLHQFERMLQEVCG